MVGSADTCETVKKLVFSARESLTSGFAWLPPVGGGENDSATPLLLTTSYGRDRHMLQPAYVSRPTCTASMNITLPVARIVWSGLVPVPCRLKPFRGRWRSRDVGLCPHGLPTKNDTLFCTIDKITSKLKQKPGCCSQFPTHSTLVVPRTTVDERRLLTNT